jgi:PIN domain nuclease of toxin-antitoxin system
MKLLLDTNVLLWMFLGSPKLSQSVREAFMEADEVIVSIVSFWEIALKASGKGFRDLDLPSDWYEVFAEKCRAAEVSILGIELAHCHRLQQLPWHHRDPFDRMLIAQAIENRLAVATADKAFRDYEVEVID